MRAKGWSERELREAADAAGVTLRYCDLRGNFYHFTLKPIDDTNRRYGQSGMMGYGSIKVIDSVCWHGHRDFFRHLFGVNPDGLVVTTRARYEGEGHFEATFWKTDTNIGSMMMPVMYSDCCTCSYESPAVEKRREARV